MRSVAATVAVAAVALLLLATASAEEPAMTAGDLAQLCSGTDHVSRNACRIYILGVTQGISVGVRMVGGASRTGRPCVPPGILAEELEATVKKSLAALDSAAERRDAAGFIAYVLLASYPCSGTHAPGKP